MSARAVTKEMSKALGIKVFSATKTRDREVLGEVITDWIRAHPDCEVFDAIVTQSSDAAFHCLTIVITFHIGEPPK